jgi:uncharacterized membrane-anchored protein YitT (DUF2179 family)
MGLNQLKQVLGNLKDKTWIANQIRQIAGIVIIAAAYLVFIIPPYIVPGGVVGLSTVVVRLTGGKLPVGGVTWCINIVLYLSTLHLFGFRHIARVFYTSTVLAILLDTFSPLVNQYIVPALYGPDVTAINANLLLYAVAGGALMGTGTAIIYRFGGATGGSDVAALALNRLVPKFSFAQYMLFVDGAIILFTVIVVRNWNLALYAIAVKFITARVMDGLLAGVSSAKGVQIITDQPDGIARRIFEELKRGVTAYPCTGMYTHADKTMLFCVVKTEQLQKIKKLVQEEDPQAFVVLNDLKEVMGKGFSQTVK